MDSPIATTVLIVISLACFVSIQGGCDLSRRMTAARERERERDKAFKTENSVISKNPGGRDKKKKNKRLCYNSCSRDLTSFFVTGLSGQPAGSVPSPNGFKSALSLPRPEAHERCDGA